MGDQGPRSLGPAACRTGDSQTKRFMAKFTLHVGCLRVGCREMCGYKALSSGESFWTDTECQQQPESLDDGATSGMETEINRVYVVSLLCGHQKRVFTFFSTARKVDLTLELAFSI